MASYQEKLSQLVFTTAVGQTASIAKDIGILEVLLNATDPLTSQEIADAKKLKERYVREVLDCLVAGSIIHATESQQDGCRFLYYLEEEEKKCLKGGTGSFISFPCILSSRYQDIKPCFAQSGPLGKGFNDEQHELMDSFDLAGGQGFTDTLVTCEPDLREKLEKGIDVMEIGSCKGRFIANLAMTYPNSCFVASDYLPSLVTEMEKQWNHVPNLSFEVCDACSIPSDPVKKYDMVFCKDVIHDLPDPGDAMRGIFKLLKNNESLFAFFESVTSGSPITDRGNMTVAGRYALGALLCVPQSFQKETKTVLGLCSGKEKLTAITVDAGFDITKMIRSTSDGFYLFVCKRKQHT